jgi:hypothetical protein
VGGRKEKVGSTASAAQAPGSTRSASGCEVSDK